MILKKIFWLILGMTALFFNSCTLFEEEEVEEERHADYYESDSFSHSNFKYLKYNLKAFEGGVRSLEERHSHRPQIAIADEGDKITLTFDKSPQSSKHYWAWFEITDSLKNEVYVENAIPLDEEKSFEKVILPEKPFVGRIRVRCFCQVHGEFVEYVDQPRYEKKSIID